MSRIDEIASEYAGNQVQFLKTVGDMDDTSLEEYLERAVKYGANAVLDEVRKALIPHPALVAAGIEICDAALVKTALQVIDEFK